MSAVLPEPTHASEQGDVRQVMALTDIAQALSGTLTLKSALVRVLEVLGRHYGLVRGCVALVNASGQFTVPTVADLTRLAELIDSGKVKPVVSKTFPFEDAPTALNYKPEDSHPGKVVIEVN